MDRFRCEVLGKMSRPQTLMYYAMHQDYSEELVFDELARKDLDEAEMGEKVIQHLLGKNGQIGHYGPIEHPSIVFNVGFFPHSVVQQARTHRIGISFDVQSFRYTGKRICDVADGSRDIENVFYLRPVGRYTNRQGKKYDYTEAERKEDLERVYDAAVHYKKQVVLQGKSEEHARSLIPFDIRQHFVVSMTSRTAFHFLDLRSKKDAQLEIQKLCELMMVHIKEWMPEVGGWYEETRWQKAKLAP